MIEWLKRKLNLGWRDLDIEPRNAKNLSHSLARHGAVAYVQRNAVVLVMMAPPGESAAEIAFGLQAAIETGRFQIAGFKHTMETMQ